MKGTLIGPLVLWYTSNVKGFASLCKKTTLAWIQHAVCQNEIEQRSNIQQLLFWGNVRKKCESKSVPEWEADGKRVRNKATLKGKRLMQAAHWGRALQVLNMDLWWALITHWAFKGVPYRCTVWSNCTSEHDCRGCAHHRAAQQIYKSEFKGGMKPFCPNRH